MGASGEDFVVVQHSFRAASEMHFLCHGIGKANHRPARDGIQVAHPNGAKKGWAAPWRRK